MSLFQAFTDQLEVYGYPVLFAGVLLENAGVPLPGETAVLLAGYLASPAGEGRFNVVAVMAVTTLAAILGDNLGFWLGRRWARPRLQRGTRFLFLTPRTLALAEAYFSRYGLWTIFFARFVSGLRVVGALAAGTAGTPWRRFLVADASGAFCWAVSMSLLGYFFGRSLDLIHQWLGRGGILLLGSLGVLLALTYLWRRLHKVPPHVFQRAAAQVGHGVGAAVVEVVCIALIVMIAEKQYPTRVDAEVDRWIGAHQAPWSDLAALACGALGTLPVVIAAAALTVVVLAYRGRPRRESWAMLGTLAVSEAVGLILVGLLSYRQVDPIRGGAWPFGFAGSVPLRAVAVFGMSAFLLGRDSRVRGRGLWTLAVVVSMLSGFGVAWAREQVFTETLLELAAGGVVLFAGLWWLEGYGSPGVARPIAEPPAADAPG